jgi:hypothetical protein
MPDVKFPDDAVRQAMYSALTSSLSVPVVVQRQPEDEASAPLVMVEPAETRPRGDIKQNTGHDFPGGKTIRVHTRYPKGKADLSKRRSIANDVDNAIRPLQPTGHRVVYLPEPDVAPQSYEVGGEQAFDLLLTYDIDTQITS